MTTDPVYINFGCGFSTGRSWRNYDFSLTLRFERLPVIGRVFTKNARRFPAEVMYGDVTRRPLAPPNTVDAAFASHVLEHLPRESMTAALENTLDMLKPGGVFRLIVPDLKTRTAAYMADESPEAAEAYIQPLKMGQPRRPQGVLGRLSRLYGGVGHRWMYDEPAMRAALAAAGFVSIRRCEMGDSDIAAFAEVEHEGRFIDSRFGAELAMEGRKPAA